MSDELALELAENVPHNEQSRTIELALIDWFSRNLKEEAIACEGNVEAKAKFELHVQRLKAAVDSVRKTDEAEENRLEYLRRLLTPTTELDRQPQRPFSWSRSPQVSNKSTDR